jgi:hypothetical protein
MDLIWANREAIYFCSHGWTGSISLIGFDKFGVWSRGLCEGYEPRSPLRAGGSAQRSRRGHARSTRSVAIDPSEGARQALAMRFEILGEISGIETFATGSGIREIARLRRIYGRGRWRKRKGIARVRLSDGSIHVAELHWYEAAGIGRKEFKIKHLL